MSNKKNTSLTVTVDGKPLSISLLNAKGIKNAALLQETARLDDVAVRYVQNEMDKQTILGEQAKILNRVFDLQLYKKDGFESIVAYANSVGLFNVSDLNASKVSQLCTAGRIYNDKKAPANLRATAPYALSGAAGCLNNEDLRAAFYKAAESHKGGFTQDEIRKLNADVKAKHGKPKSGKAVSLYYGTLDGKTASGPVTVPAKAEDWTAWAEANYPETVSIKAQNGNKRIVLIKNGKAALLVLSTKSPKAKAKAKADKAKVDKAKAKVRAAAEAVIAKADADVAKAVESIKAK